MILQMPPVPPQHIDDIPPQGVQLYKTVGKRGVERRGVFTVETYAVTLVPDGFAPGKSILDFFKERERNA